MKSIILLTFLLITSASALAQQPGKDKHERFAIHPYGWSKQCARDITSYNLNKYEFGTIIKVKAVSIQCGFEHSARFEPLQPNGFRTTAVVIKASW